MKKTLLALAMFLSMTCVAGTKSSTVHSNVDSVAKIEQVNDSTVIYRNINRIEIKQSKNNIVYIYKMDTSKLVAANSGSFTVDLVEGDYLVMSTKPFTSAKSDVIEDRMRF